MAYKVKSTGRWVAQARDPQGRRIQLGTYATRREAKDEETRYARRRPSTSTRSDAPPRATSPSASGAPTG